MLSKKTKQLIKLTQYMEEMDKWYKEKKISLKEMDVLRVIHFHYCNEIYLGYSLFKYFKEDITERYKKIKGKPSRIFRREIEKFSKVLPLKEIYSK